ncbi:MAG: hypothetical protein IJI67_06000 [Clostridia bacterium]|nr:hypothetical protein [Clostridia bacterium]
MKYIIESDKSYITVISEEEKSTTYINQNVITISRFLDILIENAVEPCHVQNVYDDIVNR